MAYVFLPRLLEREGPALQRMDRLWRPQTLLSEPFRRVIYERAVERIRWLTEAEEELSTLDRATMYRNALKRMRVALRQARFAWRTDDLQFLQNLSDLFSDYGLVLHHLKRDQARGKLGV